MSDFGPPPPVAVPPAPGPLLALRDVAGVAKRNLLRTYRTPELALYALQPVMLLLIFRYILGGAIKVPGGDYVDFVVPAIFLIAVLVGAMTTAIGLAEDLKSGVVDRLRSLPMARSAVLTGRSLTDVVRSLAVLAVMVGVGAAVGFRFHAGPAPILLGLVLVVAFGYSLSWVNATIGIAVGDPASATNAATGPTFPAHVREQRHCADYHPARLVARLRPQPAAEHHHRRGPVSVRGRTHHPRRLVVLRLVGRDHRRVLRVRFRPLPTGRRTVIDATPASLIPVQCLGQAGVLAVGEHPAGHVPTEDVDDHVQYDCVLVQAELGARMPGRAGRKSLARGAFLVTVVDHHRVDLRVHSYDVKVQLAAIDAGALVGAQGPPSLWLRSSFLPERASFTRWTATASSSTRSGLWGARCAS